MGIRERLSGNEAIAYAMKQINPDVMGAFPITPSTEIPQYFSTYVDNGEVDTEFIAVESEHSAMSTCIGAEAAGCRAISATSSCGLCYMTEMLYVAASDRLPITLAVSCRALSGPININNDHSDAMGVRDAGWLMLFAETNQEAYDNYLQAMRIAEAVSLPIMICQDGFITSHAIENIELVETEKVKEFVGEYKPQHFLLNKDEPMAVGAYATPVYYMEAKRQQAQAMIDAKDVIKKEGKGYFICYRDSIAAAIENAATDSGLKVPEDIEVLSLVGTKYANIVRPTLTSLQIDMAEVGRRSMYMLIDLLNHDLIEKSYRFDAVLVSRDSTKRD